VLGNNGTALVIEPGRLYRQIAKNNIENAVMAGRWVERQEPFVASPAFGGNRLYLCREGTRHASGADTDHSAVMAEVGRRPWAAGSAPTG
jgi:hypothetical protein